MIPPLLESCSGAWTRHEQRLAGADGAGERLAILELVEQRPAREIDGGGGGVEQGHRLDLGRGLAR